MMNRLIITADLGHLKIHRVTQDELMDPKPSIKLESSQALPDARTRFDKRDTDEAGRFPQGASSQMASGMSYGERHEEQTEAINSQLRFLAKTISEATANQGGFYLAAPKSIHKRLLELLEPAVRDRILESQAADLVKTPKLELLRRFKLT